MQVEVITPEETVADEECRLATLPTSEGEVGVEEGHAFMMATLVPGQMRLYGTGETPAVYAISGGVIDVRPDKLIIVADAVEATAEIDVERARRAKERAERRLEEGREEVDMDRAQAALARALNRLHIASG